MAMLFTSPWSLGHYQVLRPDRHANLDLTPKTLTRSLLKSRTRMRGLGLHVARYMRTRWSHAQRDCNSHIPIVLNDTAS